MFICFFHLRVNTWKTRTLNVALLNPTVLKHSFTVGFLNHGAHSTRKPLRVTSIPLRYI